MVAALIAELGPVIPLLRAHNNKCHNSKHDNFWGLAPLTRELFRSECELLNYRTVNFETLSLIIEDTVTLEAQPDKPIPPPLIFQKNS